MNKSIFFTPIVAAIFVAGCSTQPTKIISFDSHPEGARVFVTTGKNESSATGKNFIGTTPFNWTTKIDGDGTFLIQNDGIPFYSNFVQPVIVFTATPPDAATNLSAKREVYHGRAQFQHGDKAPDGIFFDLTKP